MVYAKNKFAITGPSRKKMSEIDTCHLGTRHEVPVAAPTTVRFLRATPPKPQQGEETLCCLFPHEPQAHGLTVSRSPTSTFVGAAREAE